jgi:hypothetical protein
MKVKRELFGKGKTKRISGKGMVDRKGQRV